MPTGVGDKKKPYKTADENGMKTFTYTFCSLYHPCLCMLYLPHTAAYQVNRSYIVYTIPNGVNYFIKKGKKTL